MKKTVNYKAADFFKQCNCTEMCPNDLGTLPAIGQELRFTENGVGKTYIVISIYAPIPGNFIQVNLEAKK